MQSLKELKSRNQLSKKGKRKKHYHIVSIEVLISKALIYSNINHDEFILVNNVLREY